MIQSLDSGTQFFSKRLRFPSARRKHTVVKGPGIYFLQEAHGSSKLRPCMVSLEFNPLPQSLSMDIVYTDYFAIVRDYHGSVLCKAGEGGTLSGATGMFCSTLANSKAKLLHKAAAYSFKAQVFHRPR